jgi:hypothetical protein
VEVAEMNLLKDFWEMHIIIREEQKSGIVGERK